jgi:RimJ/RimL family protein N-acetyltransferase
MTFETIRLRIREVILSDVNSIHVLHSLPETDKYNTLGIPKDIQETKIIISGWINSQNEIPRKKFIFCIENKEKEFIGLIGITVGKPNYRSAEIWYKIHSKYWSQGFATEALKSILQFCFTSLKLHRIEAGCATENIASIKVLEKAGLTREGLSRKILPIRGEWVDNYFYAILDEDYNKNLSHLIKT